MLSKSLFFIGLLLLLSCNNTKKELSVIQNLEKSLQQAPDKAKADTLILAYQTFIDNHPDQAEQNARFLFRGASVLYNLNYFSSSTELLEQALKTFSSTAANFDNTHLLAKTYNEQLNNKPLANTLFQLMELAFPDHQKLQLVKDSLPPNIKPLEARIQDFGSNIFNDSLKRLDFPTASNFIKSCEYHAMLLPDNEKSPLLLSKAAETAKAIRNFDKSIELNDWVLEQYPKHEKAAQALFFKAFTLDSDLNQKEEAKLLYETFLKKYPDNDFAAGAQFLLDNIEKSNEEIIQGFEEGE